jgi:hypothetical protein
MKRRGDWKFQVMRAGVTVPLLVALICAQGVSHGFAQDPPPEQAARDTVVSLTPVLQMRKDVELWPLIAHPKGPAQLRINVTLRNLNREFVQKVRDCISGKFAWSKEITPGEWRRSIKVTMRGPQFLSMTASDGFYCGTAHPDDDLVALVFNIETGKEVDWSAMVPKSAGASLPNNVMGDEDGTPPLILPKLQGMYAAAQEADSDCHGYFEEERPFTLWPEAESGTLVAEVAGLPHVALPCKNELKLTIGQARVLGFDDSLLQAIEEAHRISNAGRKASPGPQGLAPIAATRPDSH